MIICAAIKINYVERPDDAEQKELVVCGYRHSNCYEVNRHINLNVIKITEGFINHKGEFLDRKEALFHALECGQLSQTNRWYQKDHNINELYSEDLY